MLFQLTKLETKVIKLGKVLPREEDRKKAELLADQTHEAVTRVSDNIELHRNNDKTGCR